MSSVSPTLVEPFELDDLRRLSGIKWSRDGGDVLAAWVADMDIRPPTCVTDVLQELVADADFGYNRRASMLIPETFAAWQNDSHGWQVDPGDVRTFCDVLHAIDALVWLHTKPGDGIVLLTPIYPPFLKAIHGSGRRLIDVPLDPEGWRVDYDRLDAAIDERTKVILTCNPHNPTGRVFDDEELAAIGRVAVERDLLVISDEVWADLLHPGVVHRPLAMLSDEFAARTVTVSSASKAFNLAGLRCAVAHVGHPGVAKQLAELPAHLLGAISTPGAEATMAAWSQGRPWLESLRTHLTARRDQLAARLAVDLPDVGFICPEATYLGWLDFRPLDLGDSPNESLLEKAGVALSPGADFGPRGLGHARMNFATSASILDQILDRMAATLRTP